MKWLEAEVAIGNTVRGNYACINYCYHGGAIVVCHWVPVILLPESLAVWARASWSADLTESCKHPHPVMWQGHREFLDGDRNCHILKAETVKWAQLPLEAWPAQCRDLGTVPGGSPSWNPGREHREPPTPWATVTRMQKPVCVGFLPEIWWERARLSSLLTCSKPSQAGQKWTLCL